jgi:hypothetical protein
VLVTIDVYAYQKRITFDGSNPWQKSVATRTLLPRRMVGDFSFLAPTFTIHSLAENVLYAPLGWRLKLIQLSRRSIP